MPTNIILFYNLTFLGTENILIFINAEAEALVYIAVKISFSEVPTT